MARAFRCKKCGTGFSTTGDDVPPSPNWDDGHVCEMKEVKSKLKTFNPARLDAESVRDFNIKQEAKRRAAGYMKLKKSQCQGHSENSDREEDDYNG